MRVQFFNFNKCIHCLENPANSWEHIIPESIGGRLESKMLCAKCNNELGSEIVSKVKADPFIRLAIRNLKSEIPELFEAIEHNQEYTAKDKNNRVIKLKYKNSKLEIIAHKRENGSIIEDTKKGVKNIKKILQKEGCSEEEIAKKIESFQELENDKVIFLSKSLKVVKRSINLPFPDLKVPILDERFIALVAYEYLSLAIGNLILHSKLDFVRKFIKDGEKSENLNIEYFTTRYYESSHTIYPDFLETKIIMNIGLFGWLLYKVHINLGGPKLKCPDIVYLEDLKNKRTLFAKSYDEARQGIFYKI